MHGAFCQFDSVCVPLAERICARKKAAQIHRRATGNQATGEACKVRGFVAPGRADGTISFVLLIAAWKNIASKRLPCVRH